MSSSAILISIVNSIGRPSTKPNTPENKTANLPTINLSVYVSTFKKYSMLLCGISLSICMLETLAFEYTYLKDAALFRQDLNRTVNFVDGLREIYENYSFVNYWKPFCQDCINTYTIILIFIIEKQFVVLWTLHDMIAIALCRLVTMDLKVFNDCIDKGSQNLSDVGSATVFTSKSRFERVEIWWRGVRSHYIKLVEIIDDTGKVVFPMVLACLGCNLYFLTFNVSTHSLKSNYSLQ